MESYQYTPIIPMPSSKSVGEMTDKELKAIMRNPQNQNQLLPVLTEMILRQDVLLKDQQERIAKLEKQLLEKMSLEALGTARKTFYLGGRELTDELLIEKIEDRAYSSVYELEKIVGAGKNQLRNRYNRAKERQRLERQVTKNGDC